jgi:hypothetical protein
MLAASSAGVFHDSHASGKDPRSGPTAAMMDRDRVDVLHQPRVDYPKRTPARRALEQTLKRITPPLEVFRMTAG